MITKEKFDAYREVQYRGNWNMIMEADFAAREANLDMDDYYEIINNYQKYAELYEDE